MSELDLDEGDEERANASPAERRRMARQTLEDGKARSQSTRASSTKSRSTRTTAAQREDTEVSTRLARAFDRVAKALEARGDSELAEVIREDSEAMQQGIVSLTKSVKFLRGPLLFLLNCIEPVLAFGRVGRILYYRFSERQQRKAWEREQQVTEVVEAEVVG